MMHEQMVNEKIPEFLTYVEFGAEDNKFDAFEIREPKDDDEAVEKSVLKSRKELVNDKLTKATKDYR